MHIYQRYLTLALFFMMNSCADNSEEKTTSAPAKPAVIQPSATSNAPNTVVNPAHGQPGHRCDIAVGAPLNNTASTTAQAPAAAQTAPAVMPSAGGTLNPAHGQPGHRCDIAVGAPLNSTPSPGNQAAPVQTSPVVMPAQTAPATAKGLINPAHGQPGHRCDVAVGAPLPK